MVVFENVELSRFQEIDEVDAAILQKSFDHFFRKVSLSGEAKLHLTLKNYNKGGLKAQHELHAKLLIGGKSFFTQVTSWQLLESVQSALKKLEREVEKANTR